MPHDEPTHNDQRRSHRLHPKGGTRLEVFRDPDGTGPDIAIKVLDLSSTGAKLVLSERLPPGHVLGVAMYGSGPLPIVGLAVVVWSKEEDGAFATGIEFRRPAGSNSGRWRTDEGCPLRPPPATLRGLSPGSVSVAGAWHGLQNRWRV